MPVQLFSLWHDFKCMSSLILNYCFPLLLLRLDISPNTELDAQKKLNLGFLNTVNMIDYLGTIIVLISIPVFFFFSVLMFIKVNHWFSVKIVKIDK